ncbi:protein-tyrosine-phosphatase [Pseudopedobacter beijingensis]|uniref:Protein-tyrosine-phosphatase n=1 Tax=Pseudopedobacter beijingensis TaxID=1207056 RepID=A0ABW4IF68_9SPHI
MYTKLTETIEREILTRTISEERKKALQPLTEYIRQKRESGAALNLHFICTHNSRRSHLAQLWTQVAAAYYGVPGVTCYSGGTEATALFPQVAATLTEQGFHIVKIAESDNPVYAIKYDENAAPLIGFSKLYDHPYNPVSAFAAIMTCSQADEGCPFIVGAEQRIPIPFDDPKEADHTPQQTAVYAERSLQIAAEMFLTMKNV